MLLRGIVESLSLEVFKPTGHSPEQHALADDFEQGGVDQMLSRHPYQPQLSMKSKTSY